MSKADAIDTTAAVIEWEREHEPDLAPYVLAERIIHQVLENGCLIPPGDRDE